MIDHSHAINSRTCWEKSSNEEIKSVINSPFIPSFWLFISQFLFLLYLRIFLDALFGLTIEFSFCNIVFLSFLLLLVCQSKLFLKAAELLVYYNYLHFPLRLVFIFSPLLNRVLHKSI